MFDTMNTETGFDLMLDFLPIASEILEDAEIKVAKEQLMKDAGSSSELAKDILPILLKNKRDAVMQLVSVVSGKTLEQVKAQPISETVKILRESVRLYADFFPAALHLVALA